MKFNCPTCQQPLLADNINIQTDLALCKACGHTARVSELADIDFNPGAVQSPPGGAWYQDTPLGQVVGATTRSAIAFFLVPFMCVWSGGSLGGIYGSQIRSGEFNPLLSAFGIPFLLGSIMFWSLALMAVCGKVEVRIREGSGVVFTGIGPLGWKRRFNLDEIEAIEDASTRSRYPGAQGGSIVLRGKTLLTFASGVREDRRYFMIQALRQFKARRNPARAKWR